MPLAALPDVWKRGEQNVDVLGVVTGSIRATTLASGEAADVFDIMDCTASVPAQIMRSGMDAQHSQTSFPGMAPLAATGGKYAPDVGSQR